MPSSDPFARVHGNVTTVSASATIATTTDLEKVNAASGNIVITLPSATLTTMQSFIILRTDSSANTLTIQTVSSQTINGGPTSLTLPGQWDFVELVSDSANWLIVRASTRVGGFVKATRVVTAAGAVTGVVTDQTIVVNKTSGAATTVNLPASPSLGLTMTIKDGKGDAATNNITITPAAGTIDGAATNVINANYGSRTITYNGTEWNVV